MTSTSRVLAAFIFITAFGSAAGSQPAPPIRGFMGQGSAAGGPIEEWFRAIPKPQNTREYMRVIAAAPHHAGGEGSRKVAEYILGQCKSWGLNASSESFEALMPYPTERV